MDGDGDGDSDGDGDGNREDRVPASGPDAGAGADSRPAPGPDTDSNAEGTGSQSDTPRVPPFDWIARLRGRVTLLQAVLAVTALSILARLLFLGSRTAHWDEARVGHWIVHYNEFGSFAYRHIIHGPLIQHVNHYLFPLLGPSDFVMRLPVALVGGLLPAAAYLFREHLRDDEVVALALFLGANSVLVYYSRFMRSDLLVAAFMLAGLGALVRFYDTRRLRYLYGLTVLAALGFASKENAIVYLLTWVGAAALLADTALYRPDDARTGLERLRASWVGRVLGLLLGLLVFPIDGGNALRERVDDYRALGRRLLGYAGHLVALAALFLVVVIFLFAPRGAGLEGLRFQPVPASAGGLGLWEALARPTAFPGFAFDTLSYVVDEYASWFGASSSPGCNEDNIIDGYLCFLGRYVGVIVANAAVLGAFAVVGFASERYARARSRNLVMAAGYIGFVSVLGYPLGTDIFGAWIVVHAVVLLAVPAAVGIGVVYRWGREDAIDGDRVGAAVAAGLLVLVSLQVGIVTFDAAYADQTSEGNELVQFAQPADDLGPATSRLDAIVAEHEGGPDVVLYNTSLASSAEALVRKPGGEPFNHFRPTCSDWANTLPLNWYLVSSDADVACERSPDALTNGDQPPMIVALESDGGVPVGRLNDSYVSETYRLRAWGNEITVWTHEDWT